MPCRDGTGGGAFARGATRDGGTGNERRALLVATTVDAMGSNPPFGFGTGDREPGGSGDHGPGGPDDLSGAMPLFAELQKLLSWSGGPVNWDLARQLAVSTLGGQEPVAPAEAAAGEDALRLADLWLDEVTDLPSGVTTVESWTRLDWISKTLPVWSSLCDPVAARVVAAMSSAIPAEQMQAMGAGNPLTGILSQVGGLMFGAQVGQGLGGLAQEVVGSTDIGIPLGPIGVAALVPQNVAAFGEGLERPDDEVRLYLALREAAHQRLFAHVPWLRQRLLATVEEYSKGIAVDMSAIERAMGEIDPTDPESMQNALTGGLFSPQETPEQLAALRRLETLLALVEGWVDAVVAARRAIAWPAPTPCARPRAVVARRVVRPSRRSRPWSDWSCAHAGCAKRLRCGGASPRSTACPGATQCGPIPTSCRLPRIWMTHSASPTRWADTSSPVSKNRRGRTDEPH